MENLKTHNVLWASHFPQISCLSTLQNCTMFDHCVICDNCFIFPLFQHLAASFTVLRSLGCAKTSSNADSSRMVRRNCKKIIGQKYFTLSYVLPSIVLIYQWKHLFTCNVFNFRLHDCPEWGVFH